MASAGLKNVQVGYKIGERPISNKTDDNISKRRMILNASVYGLLSPRRNIDKVIIPYTKTPKTPDVVYFLVIKKISPYQTISNR